MVLWTRIMIIFILVSRDSIVYQNSDDLGYPLIALYIRTV